ncbi:putative ferredoxin-like protein YdhY [Neomoorella glycerini]|uniref:Putative ferredoxin-like protein YdhY n=1 Tax=Neomoorella glycerini TaxID=55779 RepID=A0A6I5ZUP8_9FIRM|nr:4Fe-4S binding protein [Moorella glycerini]QGP93111.1 putative ferredoxin-like protein YdhY [Moorella glycerini]
MARLKLNKNFCTGCRTCEYACSLAHGGAYNPEHSRIRLYRTGCLQIEARYCVQCSRPRCVGACPRGAIHKQDEKVTIDPELCDGCGICQGICNRIMLDRATEKAVMCDGCGACVPACPERALALS